jgi:hypothetical protein
MEGKGAVSCRTEGRRCMGVWRAWSSSREESMTHTLIQLVVGLLALALLVSPVVLANKVDLNRGEPEEPDVL